MHGDAGAVLRVLLDTTYAARAPHSGTAVYVRELTRALRAADVEVVEAANPARRGAARSSARNALADQWWTNVALPRRMAATRADVLHHPLPAHTPGVAQVVTVHDLAFDERPDLFAARYATWARVAHPRAARAAGAVVAVSHTTANAAMTRWGLHRERVVVALHGPGQALGPVARGEPRHVLYVGDAEPRKNLALLEAAERDGVLPLPLRRARGGEDLAPLLAHALALVHPAVLEGFGLTCLEALAAGVPVVAYPAAAVVEICGDAARYARTPAELGAALRDLPDGDAGRRRAERFSWASCAEAHIDAYTLARR